MPTEPGGLATEPVGPVSGAGHSRGMPRPGEQLGHYRIARLLGEGGMGAVFDAEDLESGRRVALKVLSQALDSPEARERFFREGRMAASINHPNSVYVFGTEEIGGIPAITMELVAGGTLQDRVRDRGPLPVAEAVDAVLQIIAGLEAAQQIGILHRDIKPSNCFRDLDGTVKIGDFGLSISTTIRTEPALTSTGGFLGTPAFCSPEQLRGDELNVRSDMYSVGATLFYLLTGHTPFEAKNAAQMLATVLERRAPSPAKFRPELPRGLSAAVLRCLQKQPGERFRNYREFAAALTPYSSTAPTPATLGLRCAAGVLDQVFISVLVIATFFVFRVNPFDFLDMAGRNSAKFLLLAVPSLVTSLLYYGLLEGIWGASVGKAICRLRVIGPDRNVPGIGHAMVRAAILLVLPALPYWLGYALEPKKSLVTVDFSRFLLSLSFYIILALFFSTARRRNGFAAFHDLITKTRVVSRTALEARTALATVESPQMATEGRPKVGPYHVLEKLEETPEAEWLLAFDSRLLRKVWVRVVPPGTPPAPHSWRNLSRQGRLRWLTGRRSADGNWDAFEAVAGQPLLNLAQSPQPWRQVRCWLYDLAQELAAAGRDGTLPTVLAADRVWITGDGRAKLLDFPGPGTAADGSNIESVTGFLGHIAMVALAGRPSAAPQAGVAVSAPLPVYARQFLDRLPKLPDAETVENALKPLLLRVAEVTRWRRVAILMGCLALPLFSAASMLLGGVMLDQLNQTNSGVMDLNMLLQQRTTYNHGWMKNQPHPTDRQFSIYIASHYRSVITNDAVWNGTITSALIAGDRRTFAEQSVAANPAPTDDEIKDADTAMKPLVPATKQTYSLIRKPSFMFLVVAITLAIYVGVPAVLAALLFRGGLVLLISRVTFVRDDGVLASRPRLFGRALIVWSPILLGMIVAILLRLMMNQTVAAATGLLLMAALALISTALPSRGIPDRIAGTWPVPR